MLIPISLEDYGIYKSENPIPEFVIKGLPKRDLGVLIAPPDTGKSHLCLSIAYELATGLNILGVRPSTGKTCRTLYWPVEDGIHQAFNRIEQHLKVIPKEYHPAIKDNVSLYESGGSILSATRGIDQQEVSGARRELDRLISHAKNFDLVIIDTIREAIGTATEVEDDVRIKEALKELAQKADVAVLITHHPTKNVIRGLEGVSTASGSGLSCTVAFARCHLYINTEREKKGGEVRHTLLQPKANFLTQQERIRQSLFWRGGSLLSAISSTLEESDELTGIPNKALEGNKALEPRKKPLVIEATEEKFSEKSRRLAEANKATKRYISDDLVQKYLDKKRS